LMNLVIGQGYMLVTPLQMARYAAALGNGGILVTPHFYGEAPPVHTIEGVTPETWHIVKLGMHRVVYGNNGTGKRSRVAGIDLAGKSGTAQKPPRLNDDAWFIAFAPFDDPEIAVAVVVEDGGGGGATAAPIAGAVIEAYLQDRLRRHPEMAAANDSTVSELGSESDL
jgi:penicillin-binding protein 2